MRSYWPRLCGTTRSSSVYEPFAFMGAAPILKYFQGTVQSLSIPSYSFRVPNPLWKNFETIKRNMFEFDQTRELPGRIGQHGVRVAQLTDYLLANVILQGSTAGSQYFYNFDDNQTYTMTYDALPIYGQHTMGGLTFNNILTGQLPNSEAGIIDQDIAITANQLQRCVQQIQAFIASLVDNTGSLLYPDFDAARQLILMFPPILGPAAELAFRTQGTLGGSGGTSGSSGSTTNIGYKIVKDILIWNLLQGCPNMTTGVANINGAGYLSPPTPTTFWWAIDGDYIKPFYFQRFIPLAPGQTIPLGDDPAAQAAQIVKAMSMKGIDVRPEDADVYAATEVDSNLGAIGSNAQLSVVTREEFFISSRSRQMVYGSLWWTIGQVDPVGASN
jgi:hypothetical protein